MVTFDGRYIQTTVLDDQFTHLLSRRFTKITDSSPNHATAVLWVPFTGKNTTEQYYHTGKYNLS